MPRGASEYWRTARAWKVVNDNPGPGEPTGPVKYTVYAFSFWHPYPVETLDRILEDNLPDYDRLLEKFAVAEQSYDPTPVLRGRRVVNSFAESKGLGLFRWAILDGKDNEIARIDPDSVLSFGGVEKTWRRGA